MPLADVADLIVIGDAEAPLPALLALWERHGNTPGFLAAAATVPGVFVPAHHDPREVRIRQSVADDISITLRSPISVSHDGTRRLEIARGCQYKCTFCSLGWRAPVRENPAPAVVAEIRRSPKRVHLQAGDAESHSGIAEIRAALRAMGGLDTGWTGRLDTLLENPDQSIPSQKRYAFGVEGVSFRLRRAVGKGYLTDERLISDTVRFLDSIEGDGVGRAAWHLIAGLPTERPEESLQLLAVLREIEHRRRGRTPRILSLHWQPFQPLPGTPMQWCPSGTGAHRQAAFMRAAEGWGALRVRQHGGRHDATAQLCAVLARSDARGANLLELLATRRRVSLADAERVTGMTAGAIDVDAPLPWDFIDHAYPRATLARAYHAMMRRLTAPPDDSPADHPEPTACLA